jgi:hypothetical protein
MRTAAPLRRASKMSALTSLALERSGSSPAAWPCPGLDPMPVLILGRFTNERKAVLDALREELRKRNYLPILFDFAVPATRDITETASLLARMARFIIADLTDPSSIPKELEAIVPGLAVPVQPLLEGWARPYSMFKDCWKYDWVLPVYQYEGLKQLLATHSLGSQLLKILNLHHALTTYS